MKPSTPKTGARLRRHADAPANWQWNPRPDGTGRPRWIPSPNLRKAGWKALMLKDAAGQFLSEGQSRDAAREINAAVEAWRSGQSVPPRYRDIAPIGSVAAGDNDLPQATDRLSIGRLIEAYFASREFAGSTDAKGQQTGGLRPSTQRGYKTSLKRLIDTLAGYVIIPSADDAEAQAKYAHAVATVRAAHASILKPVETKTGMVNLLYKAYWNLHEQSGQHQAYAVLAATSAWLKWVQRHQSETIRQSWASEVSRTTPPGRIRPLTWEEIKALVTTADGMGLHSMGDAIILGLDLSWSQVDRLQLTWDRLKDGRAFTGTAGRIKTGRVGGAPLTSLGRARVAQILERQRAMPARPTHVIWCELTNRPWRPDHFRHKFAEVREAAAQQVPSVATARDQDLRDTAFTWMKNAGLSDDGIASRTLQSRQHIAQLGDANYGEIGPAIADPAAAQFDAYLTKIGAIL